VADPRVRVVDELLESRCVEPRDPRRELAPHDAVVEVMAEESDTQACPWLAPGPRRQQIRQCTLEEACLEIAVSRLQRRIIAPLVVEVEVVPSRLDEHRFRVAKRAALPVLVQSLESSCIRRAALLEMRMVRIDVGQRE